MAARARELAAASAAALAGLAQAAASGPCTGGCARCLACAIPAAAVLLALVAPGRRPARSGEQRRPVLAKVGAPGAGHDGHGVSASTPRDGGA